MIRFLRNAAAPLAVALLLAGCGSSELFKSDTIDVACPPLGSLKEAEELVRFRPGPGKDLTDVALEARVGRVVGKCQVKQSVRLATVLTGVEIFADKGPAMQGQETELEYFIAIRAPNGEIAARESYKLPIDFKGLREARAVDYLTFQIPNAMPEALRAYRIFIGLQMSREEFDFIQRSARRR